MSDGEEQTQGDTATDKRYIYEMTNLELYKRGVIARQLLLQLGYQLVETARPLSDKTNRMGVYKYTIEVKTNTGQLVDKFEDTSYAMLTGGFLSTFVYDDVGRVMMPDTAEMIDNGMPPRRRKR